MIGAVKGLGELLKVVAILFAISLAVVTVGIAAISGLIYGIYRVVVSL